MGVKLVPKSLTSSDLQANKSQDARQLAVGVRPGVDVTSPVPGSLTPANLRDAYSLPSTTDVSATQTIAIVDAYDDPTAEADLAVYSAQFGLPACTTANGCFGKVNQQGNASPLPAVDGGWATEISLDVDMAHAICPECKILLVEATTNSFANIGVAVNRAATMGATEISNSYGGSESSYFLNDQTYNHPGVVITASAGDSGYLDWQGSGSVPEYPGSSPGVVSVGGTSMTYSGGSWHNTVWDGSGGGCSTVFTAKPWQSSVAAYSQAGCGGSRLGNDVSAVADPYTGVAVYDTTPDGNGSSTGWAVYGGTSVSAPIIAGVWALAGGAQGVDYPTQTLYSNLGGDGLDDVATGSNGYTGIYYSLYGDGCDGTIACNAASGFDGPTGVGSPLGLSAFSDPLPETTITAQPSDPSGSTNASFSFTASDVAATFACDLDGAGYVACTSPREYTSLAAGTHVFSVRASNADGTDPSSATYAWTVDAVAPETTITTMPSDPSGDANPSFFFTSSEPNSTFECDLDGAGYVACTSPGEYVALVDGAHTFSVKATDAADNTDPSPATYAWTVDVTLPSPETSTTDQPTNPSNNPVPTFSFSSDQGGASFGCALDGDVISGTYAACGSPYSTGTLVDGEHTFCVRARNNDQVDATPACSTWVVDTAAPVTTITSKPRPLSNQTDPTFILSSSKTGSTFQCRLDGDAYTTCTSLQTYHNLADGPHMFSALAADALGNQEVAPASYEWTVNATPPTCVNVTVNVTQGTRTTTLLSCTQLTSPSTYAVVSSPAHGTLRGFDASTGEAVYDPEQSYTGPDSYSYKAANVAGESNTATVSIAVVAGPAARPTVRITSGPRKRTRSHSATLRFRGSVGTAFRCRLNRHAWRRCTNPVRYRSLSAGLRHFYVVAVDANGRTSATVKRSWRVL